MVASKNCRMGRYCSIHNFVHGAEAEELREKIKKLLVTPFDETDAYYVLDRINSILDEVDARDSLAWAEYKDEEF